jgi:hypothetical protein
VRVCRVCRAGHPPRFPDSHGADRVDRSAPDRLWVTVITEHPGRHGGRRRRAGWLLAPRCWLVDRCAAHHDLGHQRPGHGHRAMRAPPAPIHSDHGTQFISWAFTRRAIDSGSGPVPSMDSIGSIALMTQAWSGCGVPAGGPAGSSAVDDPGRTGATNLDYLESFQQSPAPPLSARHVETSGVRLDTTPRQGHECRYPTPETSDRAAQTATSLSNGARCLFSHFT